MAATGDAVSPTAPSTVPGIAELGVTMQRAKDLDAAGYHKKAERWWREALQRRIALLGADVPDLAPAYERLASNLEAQGRWRDAERYRMNAVDVLENNKAADPAELGRQATRLSRNLEAQGRMAEAATVAYFAMSALCRSGTDTVDAAWGYNNVGAILSAQGKLVEAEPFYRRALEIRRQRLGAADVDTVTSFNNYGALLGRLGRVDQAVQMLRLAFEARERDNPVGDRAAESAVNLGITLDANGRAAEATPWLQKAAAIWRARKAEDDILGSDTALAVNLVHLGRAAEAEPALRRVLAVRREQQGEHAALTGQAWSNLGVTLDALGRHREALSAQDKALAIALGGGPTEMLRVADYRANRAACLNALGRKAQAIQEYRLALPIYTATLGAEAPRTQNARRGAAGEVQGINEDNPTRVILPAAR
ncbi:tetratricopeptide repeat protein [Sphingomonas sp.]|uniref:tetratricopeptide repeat protein n=1 Tax=Sphingomonas sp. TaxID=28214 RepID=UPI003B3A32D9